MSIDVEVPRRGITSKDVSCFQMSTLTAFVDEERCSLIWILAIAFGFVIGGIVASVFMFEAFGWYL